MAIGIGAVLLAAYTPQDAALTAGFHRALLVCAIFLLAAAASALRATNGRRARMATAATSLRREPANAPKAAASERSPGRASRTGPLGPPCGTAAAGGRQ
jgi:hypothetical protein